MNYESTISEQSISSMLAEKKSAAGVWALPEAFDLSRSEDVAKLKLRFKEGEVASVRDEVGIIAGDMFELDHPGLKDNESERKLYVESVLAQGIGFGTWFRMPWSKELVRYPDIDTHRNLRTFRNRNLVTNEEQARLYEAKVAVFGLSVGSKVVEQLVESGIGGTVAIGDPDYITPSNLNRLDASMAEVGMKKIHMAARKISQVDPYVKQVHFEDGLTMSNLGLLADIKPDIIFDEVDDIKMKARMREFAHINKIPLVMATDLGDRSMIDVERHDREDIAPFRGRVSQDLYEKLLAGECSPEELKLATKRIIGLRHVTTRMIESVIEVDRTLAGMPQLGDTATIGGGLAAKVAREILLGRRLKTGRYVLNPKQLLHLDAQASFSEGIKAVKAVRNFGK